MQNKRIPPLLLALLCTLAAVAQPVLCDPDPNKIGGLLSRTDGMTEGIVEAWEKVFAKVDYRRDGNFLGKLSELMSPNLVSRFPNGQADIDGIIEALKHPHTGTTHAYLKNAAEYLDDIKHLMNNFHSVPGIEQVVQSLRNSNIKAQDGNSHLLTEIKKHNSGDIAQLEAKILDADDLDNVDHLCTNCLFDIKLKIGENKFKYLELKSYSEGSINSMPYKESFKNQFKAYLAASNDFEGLQYVFNGRKTQNLTLIQEKFKTIFKQSNYGIYEEIKMANPNLWLSLNINNIDDFIDKVNTFDKNLYKFITIKK